MQIRNLDYQDRVLKALERYLDALDTHKTEADQLAALAAQNPNLPIPVSDFAKQAWEGLKSEGRLPASRRDIPFSPRHDGCKRPVPNAVLKVPTAGGKTFLAVSAVSRIMSRYLATNTGFVLWVVPNEAIYTQTLKSLKDRTHPYRLALERSAMGKVKILEKTNRLDARDVESHLCVMLLMLQSSNRQNKESLKMFRDRGDVHGFVPPEGEQQQHAKLLDNIPNLDGYHHVRAQTNALAMVKDSLGNALRIIRPIVVLDEGHRAISELAFSTLYDFNPCFVLELTATPQDVQPRGGRNPREARYANVLVEITGVELDREGMIKMPINLNTRQGTDWRATLGVAIDKLQKLDQAAKQLRANTNRCIRPIVLVQVERTGKDQRDANLIHAEDVRERLIELGFDEAEIAIKTAEQNDLKQPENQDLLSPTNRVRFIITKQALGEGWDCPFAYVLCALAANSNLKAMTQLIGRIMRQPYAAKTNIAALDECHVITHHAGTASVVEAIKNGLERDGLGDLVLSISQDDTTGNTGQSRQIKRRPKFKSTQIYLPKVMVVNGKTVRQLDYETDVLSAIDWDDFDPIATASAIPENAQAAENQLQRIALSGDSDQLITSKVVAKNSEILVFDPVYAARSIADLVPNSFIATEIVGKLLEHLAKRGFNDATLGKLSSLITETLRSDLATERNKRTESLFKRAVTAGRIQFRLRLDGNNWRMPFSYAASEPENARQLVGNDGLPLQRSLFTPVYESELNDDERDVAVYLDADQAINWWHRNVARTQYGLQGWQREKVYPDFVFATTQASGNRLVVLETKGDHLDNNDTAYKRNLLEFLTNNFDWDQCTKAGELELVRSGETVQCALVLMSEWRNELPNYITAS